MSRTAERAEMMRCLSAQGFTYKQIARMARCSYQRVGQLVAWKQKKQHYPECYVCGYSLETYPDGLICYRCGTVHDPRAPRFRNLYRQVGENL